MTVKKSLAESLDLLFDELVEFQRKKLFTLGERFVPNLTTDDILQPNDFPELENNPIFRYEEGVFEGIMTAQAAVKRLSKDLLEG